MTQNHTPSSWELQVDKWIKLGKEIILGIGILALLSLLVLLFERAGPENGPEEWNQQAPPQAGDQQQMERLWQKRYIDDQESRLQKLERDLWDRENERLISGKK